MKVPPPGNGGSRGNRLWVIPGGMGRDPRVPTLKRANSGMPGLAVAMDFNAKKDYILNVVAKHVGEVKDLADLGKLSMAWTAELFDLKPGHNYYAALILKNPQGKLEIQASQGTIETVVLELDSPEGFISFAIREKKTIHLPNVLAEDQGEREFRYLEETRSMAMPSSQSGVDISQLIRIGDDKPCFLAAPLEFKGEIMGALFLAIGVGFYFERGPQDLVIASELASQIAFGIKLLQEKGIST